MTSWRAYTDLAWTESVITSPGESAEETEKYVKAVNGHAAIPVKTLLHLGCGAGMHDYTFKKYYHVTGLDISGQMLSIAREINPDVKYVKGDMRTANLMQRFDAVAIPDSIMHMTTDRDLEKTISAAAGHLSPGGVLLIVAHAREDFRNNNFVYTGSRGDTEVTIFENNYIVKPACNEYEVTLVYLIRRGGKLEIHSERRRCGLFSLKTWLSLFKEAGLQVAQTKLGRLYDRFITGEGKYVLRLFLCRHPARQSSPPDGGGPRI